MIRWIRKYEQGGIKALKAKKVGRGVGRFLDADQEKRIKRLITDKYPDQLKLSYALWSPQAVRDVIKQELCIDLSIRTVGKYLSLWGFTAQKPLKKAYEQDPKRVKKCLDSTYPSIKAQAKAQNGEIYWGDETGIRSDCHGERGYAPVAQTPLISLCAKRSSTNLISAITNQGKVRFMVYDSSMTAVLLIEFMKRLIQGTEKKVFLILDNLQVHHAKVVKTWLEARQETVEVFYLPAYSPELNPDEYLNCDLTYGVHSAQPLREKDGIKRKVRSHMQMLQKKPARVKKYFKHPSINYAA